MSPSSTESLKAAFMASQRKHVLMITNHGIHQWNVVPGLPDTGGQNVFVNQLTETLERAGLKITIVNRGGYAHPVTGEIHEGVVYKNENSRIFYIEDDIKAFVHKEEMEAQLPDLIDDLSGFVFDEGPLPDLIVSHYWDGAALGVALNNMLQPRVPHVWIPHSLGSIKKRNVKPYRWPALKIDRRIEIEQELVHKVDFVADTSTALREALRVDYQRESDLFLPPCVQTDRYAPSAVGDDHEIWSFLENTSGMPAAEIRRRDIVSEISRTDTTKRKNILIDAFSRMHQHRPDTFLIVAVDENEKELSEELHRMIERRGIERCTAVIGNEWERLPTIYAVSSVYCSPSIMEGFGMSVQEAAATAVPVVGSTLIPFVTEFLLGDGAAEIPYLDDFGKEKLLKRGRGAVAVPPDDPAGFAEALEMLLSDTALRREMGRAAFDITIPYFTWDTMVDAFLTRLGVNGAAKGDPAESHLKPVRTSA